ncbi:tyrosine-protein phosphatase [Micromonospora sp. NPDC003197]
MDVLPVNRVTNFSNVFNFRDVGGYTGLDGRAVRWRRLYRSDSPHRICGPDQETFTALAIRTVIDLRRPGEVARDGRVPDCEGLSYLHIPPKHSHWEKVPYDEQLGVARYLADRYRDMTTTGTDGITRAIGVIADQESAPVMVHCVAGKDRTGVLCALTLSLLGVSDADIAADYALTDAAAERFTAYLREHLPEHAAVPVAYHAAPAEAMLMFLTELRERHGSVERYVRDAGLESDQIAALRAHLLS